MERLVEAELVKHERIFYGTFGIYYLTKLGAGYTDLPPIKNIPKDSYDHQLAIIEVYFKLKEKYPNSNWISERHIKREKYMKGIGSKGHLADGMLILPDDIKIAIEVELTMKSKMRVKQILKNYRRQFDIEEVWYYCSENISPKLNKLIEDKDFIKVHSLD